jgi:YceI-like domain
MTEATPDLSGTWDLDPAHTRLGFAARHAMVATVRGNFAVFAGVLRSDGTEPGLTVKEISHPVTLELGDRRHPRRRPRRAGTRRLSHQAGITGTTPGYPSSDPGR